MRVSGADHARLGDRADELTSFDGHRAFMKMVDGRCAALRLEPATGIFRCDVYETRPEICRTVARGSSACEAERAAKTDRPLIALRRARAPR